LTFEPGIEINNYNVKKYDILVAYKNIEYSIIKQINIINTLDENGVFLKNEKYLLLFKNEIIDNFKKNLDKISNNLEKIKKEYKKISSSKSIKIPVYALNFDLDFHYLHNELNNLLNI
jgi:hypothetical protein